MTASTYAPLYGIDISNWNAGVDLQEVRREGFNFVFAKVSEGSSYQDPTWPGFRDAAKHLGLILAGYHYVKEQDDPAAQAKAFVDHLGDTTIPAMLDFEQGSGAIDVFWAVLHAIEALGVKVKLSYIPHWYWQQIGSPDISAAPGLIQSSYVGGMGPASVLYQSVPQTWWGGFGGATPVILQFTSQAYVAKRVLDSDAFLGTRAELSALLGIPEPPLPLLLPQPPGGGHINPEVLPGLGHQFPIELTR